FSQYSSAAFSYDIPRGQTRSTRMRTPSSEAGISYIRLMFTNIKQPSFFVCNNSIKAWTTHASLSLTTAGHKPTNDRHANKHAIENHLPNDRFRKFMRNPGNIFVGANKYN